MTGSLKEKVDVLKACVIIPTNNNVASLASVIEDVAQHSDHIIIINDGSTDNTATTMITEFRKFNCTTHLLLLVAVCCCVVLLGALFRLTSIKLICGQQNSQLGNNWATNISKKVELGNKKEKEKCTETQQKQALNKQKKVNYFPIQNLLNI